MVWQHIIYTIRRSLQEIFEGACISCVFKVSLAKKGSSIFCSKLKV